jgi:hypothetical protein
MTTRETLEKIAPAIRYDIEEIRKDYKNPNVDKNLVRARLSGYTKALASAGVITESERRILFNYGTV